MLLGQWTRSLTTNRQLTLPGPVREALVGGGVITRGIDGGLWLFPRPGWEALGRRISARPFFHPARRTMERFLFSSAQPCYLDRQGRIPLAGMLCEWAKIEQTVVIVGLQSFVELWAPDRWEAQQTRALAAAEDAAALLDGLTGESQR